MEKENKDTDFKYTYSAKEQDEIAKIRQKYQMKEEDGISKLRKLDEKVSQKAVTVSLILGVIGALIMGTGMSFIMTDLSAVLGIAGGLGVCVGIIAGVVGMALMALAYPIYNKVLKREREKAAPEILRLAEELIK